MIDNEFNIVKPETIVPADQPVIKQPGYNDPRLQFEKQITGFFVPHFQFEKKTSQSIPNAVLSKLYFQNITGRGAGRMIVYNSGIGDCGVRITDSGFYNFNFYFQFSDIKKCACQMSVYDKNGVYKGRFTAQNFNDVTTDFNGLFGQISGSYNKITSEPEIIVPEMFIPAGTGTGNLTYALFTAASGGNAF